MYICLWFYNNNKLFIFYQKYNKYNIKSEFFLTILIYLKVLLE